MSKIELLCGDYLQLMKQIPDKSVDMILCDPPYGTTACKWDSIIPFDKMWESLNRVIKPNGGVVLFSAEPFTAKLICSNINNYRHKWVWNKNNSCGFATVNIRPFQVCEDIIVFGKNKVNYYPIIETRGEPRKKGGYSKSDDYDLIPTSSKNNVYYPKNLLNQFPNNNHSNNFHPTQKPVALLQYLIKTYTKENETVLDFTMGSGSTGVACKLTNRNFIGIELDKEYFDIAKQRIENGFVQEKINNIDLNKFLLFR